MKLITDACNLRNRQAFGLMSRTDDYADIMIWLEGPKCRGVNLLVPGDKKIKSLTIISDVEGGRCSEISFHDMLIREAIDSKSGQQPLFKIQLTKCREWPMQCQSDPLGPQVVMKIQNMIVLLLTQLTQH